LVDEVFRRVIALPPDRWQTVADIFIRALYEKHFLIAANDPEVASLADELNFDGAVRPPAGDFLLVVDANLAALKTDSVVARAIHYAVKTDQNGRAVAEVRLNYKNNGGFSWKTTRYRTYTRIFVPAGSELIAVTGNMLNDKINDPARRPGKVDVADELGLRSFGTFLSVEPGEVRELVFTYRLPESVFRSGQNYALYVQKQPGTVAVPLTLELGFDKRVASAAPEEMRDKWGDNVYSQITDLIIDREFDIGF
jgi:hypothetical protein